MQDRQNINNDPTLVDRGWTQMHAQLDEVMPVRKRRFIPWWIFLFLLGTLVTLGAYGWEDSGWGNFEKDSTILKSEQKEIKTTEQSAELPIAQIESKEASVTQENNNNERGNNENKQFSTTTSSANVQATTRNKNREHQIEPIKNQHQIDANQSTLAGAQLQEQNATAEELLPNTTPTVRTENTLEESTLSNPSRETVAQLTALETVDFGLLKNNTASIERGVDIIAPKKSHFIIQAGVESGLGSSIQTGGVGLAYQHSTNRAFSYEIGLNYQTASVSWLSDAIGFSSKANDGNRPPGLELEAAEPGMLPTFSINQTYSRMEVDKISLDVSIRKKINHRWSLAGGIQISYFTKATLPISSGNIASSSFDTINNNEVVAYNLYDQSVMVYDIDIDAISNLVIRGVAYDLELKHWQTNALLRAQYKVSKHWELEASFRRALTKWPDNRKVYGANSFIGLGLRYYVW